MKITVSIACIFSFYITLNGQNVGIGGVPASSAALDIQSTTGALVMPRMTTAQRNALNAFPGMTIYNTDVRKFQGCYEPDILNTSSFFNGDSMLCAPGSQVGQSFTIGAPGLLTRIVVIPEMAFGEFDFVVRLGNSATGTILSVNPGLSIMGDGYVHIDLTTPIPVLTGEQYTFQFTSQTGSAYFIMNTTDPYPGGLAWLNTNSVPANDLLFFVYVTGLGWANLH